MSTTDKTPSSADEQPPVPSLATGVDSHPNHQASPTSNRSDSSDETVRLERQGGEGDDIINRVSELMEEKARCERQQLETLDEFSERMRDRVPGPETKDIDEKLKALKRRENLKELIGELQEFKIRGAKNADEACRDLIKLIKRMNDYTDALKDINRQLGELQST